jgi:predicted metalloprotease with PDZ domain
VSDAPVRYTVRMADPHAHLFEVCIDIPAPAPEGACLRLPAWIPGSYMVRDFARHVISLQATSLPADLPAPAPETGDGHADEDSWSRHGTPVAVRKTDKSTWQCAPCAGPLRVRLEVYAFDLSVRGAWLDQSRGYFNGVCLFPAVRGCESAAAQVGLVRPEGQAGLGWQVATSMRAQDVDSGGFGTYTADDYQDLIDHPVEMSDVDVEPFEVAGVAHRLVLTGRQRYDVDRLTQDLQAVCREHHGMLPAPDDLDRYVFLVHVADRMGGGLEHRWSNSCIVARDMLPRAGMAADDRRYARLLALLSHEYFHLWHVKRTQPAAFQPFDLGAEQYTQTLWVFEGITSYYDTLALVRAGVISEATYLELLAERIGAVSAHTRPPAPEHCREQFRRMDQAVQA